MKIVISIALALAVLLPTVAEASTSCTTRKSGSTTITSCSRSGHGYSFTQCRSYRSGSVVKTSCR